MGVGQSSFSCPGGASDGVRCYSARDVYKMTDKTDSVRAKDGLVVAGEGGMPDGLASAGNQATRPVAVPSINQPLPIRTPPVVMRIWVAPWEDDAGDLHADGYIYTEIEERRWNLGGRHKGPKRAFSPLVQGEFADYKQADGRRAISP
jgi:conjugal transfer pilus assembly protein TraV